MASVRVTGLGLSNKGTNLGKLAGADLTASINHVNDGTYHLPTSTPFQSSKKKKTNVFAKNARTFQNRRKERPKCALHTTECARRGVRITIYQAVPPTTSLTERRHQQFSEKRNHEHEASKQKKTEHLGNMNRNENNFTPYS
jgi:hypothetical protein